MAAFLDGLFSALKGIGSDIGDGISKAGSGLMHAIDPALGSTPGGMAAKPGTGGLMSSTADLANSDLGDFHFAPDGSVIGQRPATAPGVAAPPAQPGFFKRINTADPATGLSPVDKWDRFGARLQDINEGGDRAAEVDKTAATRLAKTRQTLLSQQIDALFPNDPQMRFLLKANPDKATAALATVYEKRNEPANVSGGDTRIWGDPANGGSTFTAPKYGEADGFGYKIGPDGVDWGAQRSPTHGEVETNRHNMVDESQGGQKIGLEGQRVGIERANSGIAAGHLDVARGRLDFDKSSGGGNGLGAISTEDLIKALRGGE